MTVYYIPPWKAWWVGEELKRNEVKPTENVRRLRTLSYAHILLVDLSHYVHKHVLKIADRLQACVLL